MLSIFRKGTEYSLDDGAICNFVGDAGWGSVKIQRLGESGPLQNGETDTGFRFDTRIGQLVLQLNGSSRDDMYERRADLMDIFAPDTEALNLRWQFESMARQIDVHLVDVTFDSNNRAGFSQKAVAIFRAPEAIFYDPEEKQALYSLGGGSDSYEIPHGVPHVVGSSTLDQISVLTSNGNWKSFPHRIRIIGPITDLVINHQNTGAKLDFTGYSISSTEYIDIDLRYGYKTVVGQDGSNKIDKLTADSDLSTFSIQSKADISGGENSIQITGTAVAEETSISVNWYDNYLGI